MMKMQPPTKNATARYIANMKAFGLPGLGTVVTAGGKSFKLAGLSSDGLRVKANDMASGTLVDLKLDGVKMVLDAMNNALAAADKPIGEVDLTAAKTVLATIAGKGN